MSAETLRRAAALMRERAERAPKAGGPGTEYARWSAYFDRFRRTHNAHQRRLADYCSHMHPAVALAVADWLSGVANLFANGHFDKNEVIAALAVANAYLQETP